MKKSHPLLSLVAMCLLIQGTFCAGVNAQNSTPLIQLNVDATSNVVNSGTVQVTFQRSAVIPQNSANVPGNFVNNYSLDFGTNPGNYFVESTAPLPALQNMSALTITGWINVRSTVAGSGGNRIVSWINNGGDGVDLVYQSNGSLRLGVDGWPDLSPAVSSPNKVTASPTAAAANWVFFAVTYRSNGLVEFYFGNSSTDAALDVTRNYPKGNTGMNIGNLAIGAFNNNTRGPQTYDRMFKGLINNVQVHATALSATQVVGVQRGGSAPADAPLFWAKFDTSAPTSFLIDNYGTIGGTLSKSSAPLSTNTPTGVGGSYSVDFGPSAINGYIESAAPYNELKNLESFTLTGWVNSTSNIAGSGGNRIISWINNGGDGVDLVYQSDGSLRLGVDEWPDYSPAVSSPAKVLTNAGASSSNWIFFAVTYQSSGAVKFYFGDQTNNASLDVTRTYLKGLTGSNIGNLALGNFNSATRLQPTASGRSFRGLLDDLRIHKTVLSVENIIDIQRIGSVDAIPPTIPANLAVQSKTATSATLTWAHSTDNYDPFGSGVTAYDIYNGSNLIATAQPATNLAPATFQLVGLTPNTTYSLGVRARDVAGNSSALSNIVQVTTSPSTGLEPLVHFKFDALPLANEGLVPIDVTSGLLLSDNVPLLTGDLHSADLSSGASPGIQSLNVIDQLKNMGAFTLTGWLNAKAQGATQGNVLSWQEQDGQGVNLQVNESGRLVLHVDQATQQSSPAISSAKVTADPSLAAGNWVFFAVTYQASGEASFYFGNNANDATLDVVKSLPAAGRTGTAIDIFQVGQRRVVSKGDIKIPAYYFNGLIDDIHVFASTLSVNEIRSVQRQAPDNVKPSAPTNIRVVESATSALITWDPSTDNVGVTGYEILGRISKAVRAATGPVNSFTLTGLQPATTYLLEIVALDAAFNRSAPVAFDVTTSNGPMPKIQLHLDEPDNTAPANTGSLSATFVRSGQTPSSTLNARNGGAMDFGVNPGNYFIESSGVVDGLKSMNALTITGWINNRSNIAGSGGNRIVSWINNGGDGVDLVYQSNGSLRIGIDGWPDFSPAVSSANKVPTDFSMSAPNWTFFAVTYSATGEVKFYFGNTTQDATLDVTRAYTAPGITGSNIAKLAIGNFNSATRNSSTWDRMFRGVIDEIQIFNSVLSPGEIVALQKGPQSTVGRMAQAGMSDEPRPESQSEIMSSVEQNYPNPYNAETHIAISLPHSVTVARLLVYDATGRSLREVVVEKRGEFTLDVPRTDLRAGLYIYSLVADGKVVGTRHMAVIE